MICAVCYVDPITGRIGTNDTMDICAACKLLPENQDWHEASAYERSSEDVDAAPSKSGDRIEAMFGGKRKHATTMADRVIQIADEAIIRVRRRRRNAQGAKLRGWETVEREPTEREIAELAGCSQSYVRKCLKRIIG
ncbi:MAG TPA: hypothetical protein VIA18_28265 [Polyangia bacterium]|jgi:hypothetical protein|nr:hypothetical protein [Polyangia bacterium]